MKNFFLILFLVSPLIAWSQKVYTSPVTQTWPSIFTTDYEQIKRTISFEENAIIIGSEVPGGKEFEILYIREIERRNGEIMYSCVTSDNQKVNILIPSGKQVNLIDMYKRSTRTSEEMQYRFHIFQ